jgi:hypothetical protein
MSENYNRIKIEMTEGMSSTTPQASLVFIAKLFDRSGLSEVIDKVIGARRERGAKDSEHIMAFVMSQTCGSEAIEQQKYLAPRAKLIGLKVPSVSASRSYMQVFHNKEDDKNRGMGRSYIPRENEYLSGFAYAHSHLFSTAYNITPKETITLDQDATFIPTARPEACFNYHKEKSYEAFNTYCPDYDLMVGTRYSDGNVTPGFKQLDELKRILSLLPEGVKKVSLRSDGTGYQTELMQYCASGGDERFGVIDFGISCNVGKEFKEAAMNVPEKSWRPLRRKKDDVYKQEWAEVVYVPNSLCKSKGGPEIRFFATREVFSQRTNKEKQEKDTPRQRELDLQMSQDTIDELESGNEKLRDLHLMLMSGRIYKVFGIASNILDTPGDEIILWHHDRSGKSEQAHDILKNDFGGSHVPSHLFGVNAAWWNIAVLAMNVNNMLKRFFLPEDFKNCRMKMLRNIFYTLAGKVTRHARKIVLKIWSQDSGAKLLIYALSRLDRLLPCART